MKVLAVRTATESNANIPLKNTILDFNLAINSEKMLDGMMVRDVFEKEGIELIPSILATSGPSGVIERNCFDYLESCLLNQVKKHLHELDGILMFMHGASEVDGLGSGEHHMLKKVRELVGPYMPIAIACDPHGNLCKEYVESATIIRSYRESPHTDMEATFRLVAEMLIELLKKPKNITPVYRKLPLILGGEQSVSTDEPVKTINQFMDEMEKDERLLSVSWHVGYIRHDTDVAGCGVVVIPSDNQYRSFAEEKADELAKFIWDRRHEFHYTGLTAEPEEAMRMALENENKPAFITDSGDNTTSGATGWNTFVLRQALAAKSDKRFLFASICDPKTTAVLQNMEIGETKKICLGMDADELSKAVECTVTVKHKGNVLQPIGYSGGGGGFNKFGNCVTVHIEDTNIDVIVADRRQAYTLSEQYVEAGVDWDEYDIIVVKLGYIFPALKAKAGFYVMSLTDGATIQDTKCLKFKRIMRPMYPIDEI